MVNRALQTTAAASKEAQARAAAEVAAAKEQMAAIQAQVTPARARGTVVS